MKLGAHIGISRGLAWTAAEAVRLGCECLQIFLSNPRSWAPAADDAQAEVARWRRELDRHHISPVIGHASYLVNLASPDPELYRKSLASALAAIHRGMALGADRFVIAAGYHRGAGPENARRAVARGLRELAQAAGRAPTAGGEMRLLLENTTGAGSGVGWSFEDLAATLAAAGDEPNLGVCLDTCHAHVAGYDLSAADSVREALDEFDRTVGLGRLGAMHLNDAKHPAGSRRDLHAHIGRGTIGRAGFRALLGDARLAGVAGIIETPKEDDMDARNLRLLRRLRPVRRLRR